jgi:hypothetical protein
MGVRAHARSFFSLILCWLGAKQDFVARLLVKSGFGRIRFWYPVALGSGISRETSRIYFWNLTARSR